MESSAPPIQGSPKERPWLSVDFTGNLRPDPDCADASRDDLLAWVQFADVGPDAPKIPHSMMEWRALVKRHRGDPHYIGLMDWLLERLSDVRQGVDCEKPPSATPNRQVKKVDESSKLPQATKIIKLILENCVELFKDQQGRPHAVVPLDSIGGLQCLAIKDGRFKEWISYAYYKLEGQAPNTSALEDALRTISGKALFEGKERKLSLRACDHDGAFFYDLCDSSGNAIRIDREGWRVVFAPPIFRRFQHMNSQTVPSRGDGKALDQFVKMWRLSSSEHEDMLRVALGCYFIPGIGKAVLGLHGDPGSAKSTLSHAIKLLVDPSIIENPPIPTDHAELLRALSRNYLCEFDNVRNMKDWQSDFICISTTGGTATKRALYTDDEDFARSLHASVILNGINLEIKESDLLDRSITIELSAIPKEERKGLQAVNDEVHRLIPEVLAELFDHVSNAIRIKENIIIEESTRMADWYAWAICFAESMGVGRERFQRIYAALQEKQSEYAIENSTVGTVVRSYLDTLDAKRPWIADKPTEILIKLTKHAKELLEMDTKTREWPKDPAQLSKRLNAIKKDLQEDGIWIFDTRYHLIKSSGVLTPGYHGYSKQDRIKIITRDPAPFKRVVNGSLTEFISEKSDEPADRRETA